MKKNIAKVMVGLPVEFSFDYLIPRQMIGKAKIGCRVWVPFRNRKLVGYIVDTATNSKFKEIKPINCVIDDKPIFDKKYLEFLKEFGDYYCCSSGEAIETSVPVAIKKGKLVTLEQSRQERKEEKSSSFLLIHDIPAEKKWEVFFEKIQDCHSCGGSAIFLVPESSNIPVVFKKLQENFPKKEIAIFNRKQSDKLQLSEWQKAKNSLCDIIIGTRAAIFAPLENLKLIIIDEEDSSSYKQEQMPFYHAREVAVMRARLMNLSLILASATPSLEAYHLAKRNRIEFLSFPDGKKSAEVRVIDMARFSYGERRKNTALSFPLEDSIRKVLSEGKRVILFINRKGFSNIIRCRKCDFTLKCKKCNVSLTYHFDKKKLLCRFCNYKMDPPQLCPQCNNSYLRYSGMGTEKLESEINRFFPGKRILRLDKETGLKDEQFDILIATQIILKSYSTLSADLVGVLGIDNSLNRMDFRAAEKTFALLIKLSLLAKDKVIFQTANPGHYAVFSAAQKDFPNFYKKELGFRRSLGFPPFWHFISVGLRSRNTEAARDLSFLLFEDLIQKNRRKDIAIFEPATEIPDKLRGFFRWHVLIKAKEVKKANLLIKNCLKNLRRKSGIIVTVNVDI